MSDYTAADNTPEDVSETHVRKGEGIMDKEEFASLVKGTIASCTTFADELSIDRAQATDYYKGRPFGNEEEGRSQVVVTEVRDAVLGVLPSLIRVLLGSDYPVEFVARRGDGVEQALQATEYIRYVFLEDNPGFLNTVAVLKDGLVRKIGIFKWGWDESTSTRAYRLEGITRPELEALAADENLTLTNISVRKESGPSEQPVQPLPQPEIPTGAGAAMPAAPATPEVLYDVELTEHEEDGRARVWTLPPEEFIWNREARSLDTATFCGHRTEKTRGELIAMGIDEKEIEEHASAVASIGDLSIRGGMEEVARRGLSGAVNDPEMGKANDKIPYVEGYMRIDYDGDGVAELRKICTIGPARYPVSNVPWSDPPFSIFIADPEPHTLLGDSWYDRLKDIQRIKSSLVRGVSDSLSASIFPRMTYEEGQASVADMLNTAIGAPIRIRKQGAVQSFSHPFVGQAAMPFIDFFTDMTERRVGRSNGAGGLDADALQSTDKQGVQAAISGSQEQAEMLARLFAEGCFKPMFKGLLKLFIEHQPKARTIRLRGKWVEVNPASWDADMDVTVNVALGSGFTEKKIATLMAVLAQQKEIIQTYGPENPLVTLAMFRNTIAKVLEMQGLKDAETYFMPVDPNWQPPPPQPPPPSPEEVMAQAQLAVEKMKVTRSLAEKKDELALKEKQMDLNHILKIKQMADDLEMKKYAVDAQFHSNMSQAELDGHIRTEIAETDYTIKAHDQLHDQQLELADQAHGQAMDTRAADTADATAAAAPTDGGNS